jgi:hypothetical protein
MSCSFERLAALIRTELNKNVIHGDIFIFLNKQRTTIKIMVYEDMSFSLFYRRLDAGSFQLPLIASDHISYKMSVDQMTHMLEVVTVVDGGYLSKETYVPLHGSL